jgi:hypothetical protein
VMQRHAPRQLVIEDALPVQWQRAGQAVTPASLWRRGWHHTVP